jgi:hypothetical protein
MARAEGATVAWRHLHAMHFADQRAEQRRLARADGADERHQRAARYLRERSKHGGREFGVGSARAGFVLANLTES